MQQARTHSGLPVIEPPWQRDPVSVALELGVDLAVGLSAVDAADRLVHLGRNELITTTGPGSLRLVVRQFTNAMVQVLVAAAIVTALTGEPADTIVIATIVVLNGIVGFVQEHRAQRALAAS